MFSMVEIAKEIEKEYKALLDKDLNEQDSDRLRTLYREGHITLEQLNTAFREDSNRFEGMKYKNREFGLFEAITDENTTAIKWLVQKGGHAINCSATGNNRYMGATKPLSHAAITCNSPPMADIVLSLGATLDEQTIRYAEALNVKGDTALINILKKHGYVEKKINNEETAVKQNLEGVNVKTLVEQNAALSKRLKEVEEQLAKLLSTKAETVLTKNASNSAAAPAQLTQAALVAHAAPTSSSSAETPQVTQQKSTSML